ncbi:uncharacterized protein PF11_0213 [Pseudomyrmex gracilis]|uniref:uncharacterized protein PF11_0213 n=1 Tax=Pseudomyrmex gracilis TaxID=219809 RepID=UPI000995BB46|nr:uncharacterized protein PF11_0213 [Pseudomyrmex gracilis]
MKLTTLKGIFPDPKPVRRKNFIQENVRNLRRIEKCFQATKQVDELQQLQLHKNHRPVDKYQNISAKVVTSSCEKKNHKSNSIESVSKNNVDPISSDNIENAKEIQKNRVNTSNTDKKHVFTKEIIRSGNNNTIVGNQKKTTKHNNRQKPKILSESNVLCKSNNVAKDADAQSTITYRNQGIQTLDTDQLKTIYSEGTIRYPSKKSTKHNDVINQEEKKYSKKQSSSLTERDDVHNNEEKKVDLCDTVSPAPKEETDFIKLNKERTSVANKLATQLNNGIPPTNYRKGVVPKYLRDRKEAHEKEQKAKTEALHPDCPEGHVSLPDHERKETLRLLKKNYQEYVNELNMMPIKTDTLRAQRRKVEIEKQLNKLEEGIKIFSRPKVYVKINV